MVNILTSNQSGQQVKQNSFVKFKTSSQNIQHSIIHSGYLNHDEFNPQIQKVLITMKQGQKVQYQQINQNNQSHKIILELLQTKQSSSIRPNYQKSQQLKLKGNQQIKSKKYPQAVKIYTQALNLIQYDCTSQAQPVKNSLFSNLTLALLNTQKYQQCIQKCDKYLQNSLQPNKKIVYRRANANKNLKKWQQAENDIKFGQQICKNDQEGLKDFQQLLEQVKKEKKIQSQKEKKVYSKMFN